MSEPLEDVALSEQVLAERRKALERLARERYAMFYRAVLRRVRDEADACDVVQESFAIAVASLDKFRGESLLSTWVYGIAMNIGRDFVRKRALRTPVDLGSEQSVEDSAVVYQHGLDKDGAARDPLELLLGQERIRQTSDALQRLSPPAREALYRTTVLAGEGEYNQIAEEMGVPVGTLKSRVCRAREQLRAQVDHDIWQPGPMRGVHPPAAGAEAPGRGEPAAPKHPRKL